MARGRTFGRIGDQPTREVQAAIERDEVLTLIFSEEEYVERRLVARHRIIGGFLKAIDPVTRRGTDNYIVGVGNRTGDLANYLLKLMHHRRDLVSKFDLPDELRRLSDRWIDQVLAVAVRELVIDELLAMREPMASEIVWINGHWQMIQSVADEYARTRESVAKPHQLKMERRRTEQRVKVDRRNEHGRVRSQRRRSGLASGVSTGVVPFYC